MVVKLLTAAEKRGQQARKAAEDHAAALDAKKAAAQQEEARLKALEVREGWGGLCVREGGREGVTLHVIDVVQCATFDPVDDMKSQAPAPF